MTRFDTPAVKGERFSVVGRVIERDHTEVELLEDDDQETRMRTVLRDLSGRRVRITVEVLDEP